MTGMCHFCPQKWQPPVISGFEKKDRRLSFLELAKVTVICHFRISKNDRRLSFLDSKKVTDACYFWNQKVSCGWHFPNIIIVKKRQLTCFRMTKAVPRQKGLPRGVKVCKIHYKYAKKSHTFGFKKGSLKRIFLIIYRYDYYNVYNMLRNRFLIKMKARNKLWRMNNRGSR